MGRRAAVGVGTTWARADHVHPTDTSRAPLASPAFTGTPSMPTGATGVTQTAGTNNTTLATTAFATTAANLRVLKAGDTMTGPLTVSLAANNYSLILTPTAGISAAIELGAPAAGQSNGINALVAGKEHWDLLLGDGSAEGGGGTNSGSNFVLRCWNDAGSAVIANAITIARATGVTTFSAAIVNGPSDRTLKENIAPLAGSLDKVMALQGVSFNMIASPDKPEIGLIAQDVQPIVPEVIQAYEHFDAATQRTVTEKLAIDYPKLTALLIEAVKTLAARVDALESTSG